MLDTIELWQAEYFSEEERQASLPARTLSLVGTAEVRQEPYIKPAEFALAPTLIASVDEVGEYSYDPESGEAFADVLLTLRVALEASEDEAAVLLDHHVAAIRQLLFDLPTLGGACHGLEPVGEDPTPFDVVDEAWRCAVDLQWVATQVPMGVRQAGPPPGSTPREDPYEGPWPDALTALSADVVLDPEDEL